MEHQLTILVDRWEYYVSARHANPHPQNCSFSGTAGGRFGSLKSAQKSAQKSEFTQKSAQKSEFTKKNTQKSTQKSEFTQKRTQKRATSQKSELKKVYPLKKVNSRR